MEQYSFWKVAAKNPARTAAVGPDGRTVTFGELLGRVNQISHGLRALGLKKGDAIALFIHNDIETLEATLGALQIGLYVTPVNWHLAPPEVAYIVRDSGSKVFLASERFGDIARKAADELNYPAEARFALGRIEGFRPFEDLKRGQPTSAPDARVGGLVMTYTSGTTGKPKGVKRAIHDLDPETVWNSFASFLMLFGIMPEGDNAHLVVAPLYHTAVMNFCLNSIHFGHTVVLMDKWTPEGTLERIEKYKVTHSHMVPTMFSRLLQLPEDVRKKYSVSSMKWAIHSAAPCPVELKKRMLEWWGPVIYEYYAATEGGGTLATPQQWLKKPGTVGAPWSISQIKILADNGAELPARQIGTVYMSMGQHKFEYHGDKEKTNKAWRGSFFTVGDAGYLDEDGYLFLCDRKSDMIIAGGVNIYPAEIEAEMILHPAVGDVAVFGIPNEDMGEEVKAVVELRAGIKPSPHLAKEMQDYLKDRIAKFKIPRTIDFTDALPREGNGKLMKRKLRDPYWAGRDRAI